ncbi:MAG: ATP-binding cassette domain-containing protein [Labilithrix sp.]|nr:ATP-binding cassette domain-containing protein [Labilithrix sp.]MCW5836627.1 ATP-binding cassette domain-containing protein [Labilithrix sp.]
MSAARPEAAPAGERLLEVRGLTIGWGAKVLQRDLTFGVARGEVFAILGRSGAGKSTLLRFLVGLEAPDAGRIVIAGHGPVDLSAGLPPFGVMFQAGALFGSMTVGENVRLPLDEWTDLPPAAAAAVARAKLALVGLEGAFDQLPSELSGGMLKRAAMARALALDPELVFLDEPSAGLDPITAREIDDLIRALNDGLGLTCVVVTHELESVFMLADRCIVLDDRGGGIVAEGDPRALCDSADPRVREFFNRRPRS